MSEKRIAIMGAGSMGTVLGAYISKAGRQVDLIDVNRAHVDALNKCGAQIVGFTKITVPVTALTPAEMQGKYDIFLLMTKQTFNESVFAAMKEHLAEGGIVVTLQNGLPEVACADVFGADRVLGAPISWGATMLGPGVSEITTPEDGEREFLLGTISGEINEHVEAVKQILELMCPTHISANLMGMRWYKLWINATFSGMSAVIGGTFGDVLESPAALYAVTLIGREAIRVAHASSVEFFDPANDALNTRLDFKTEDERKQLEKYYSQSFRVAAKLKASMLQDLEHGRLTEVDSIDGVIGTVGRKYGVPTPASDLVVALVHAYERGEDHWCIENANKFLSLPI